MSSEEREVSQEENTERRSRIIVNSVKALPGGH
jgi:hypothetical protein